MALIALFSKCIWPKAGASVLSLASQSPHVFTTSYLTHQAIEDYLAREKNYGYPGPLLLSPGKSIGLRMVPMVA